jgi:hypothetical protein
MYPFGAVSHLPMVSTAAIEVERAAGSNVLPAVLNDLHQ